MMYAFIARQILFSALFVLGLLQLTQTQLLAFSIAGAVLLVLRIGRGGAVSTSLATAIFGFLVPWFASFGPQTLLVLSIFFLLIFYGSAREYKPGASSTESGAGDMSWAWPIIFVSASWYCLQFLAEVDFQHIRSLRLSEQISPLAFLQAMASWFNWTVPLIQITTNHFSVLLVLIGMSAFLSRETHNASAFASVVLWGLIPAAFLFIAQLSGVGADFFPNQTDFWSGINRYSGPFSDPNAAGVFSFLILPFVFTKLMAVSRLLGGFVLTALLVFVSFSGSRTFWLASFIFTMFFAGRYYWIRASLLLLAGLVLFLNLLAWFFPIETVLFGQATPSGVNRIVSALLLSNFSETIFSRFVFWQIGWRAWVEHPFFGLGYGQFRFFAPLYAEQLQFGTGVWTDNANNFYLGILAEMGLIGACAWIAAIFRLRMSQFSRQQGGVYRAALLAFLVILLIGPHLDFVEVSLLFSWYLARLTTVRSKQKWFHFNAVICAAVALFGIVANVVVQERGFYFWEESAQGRFRWSTGRAQGVVSCNQSGTATLLVRAANPDLAKNPLRVKVRLPHREFKAERVLKDNQLTRFEIDCGSDFPLDPADFARIRYQLQLSRIWRPCDYWQTDDCRLLGVQVFNQVN